MDEMEEIINEFLVESQENLDQLDEEFVELERDPTSAELLGSIFRTIHTIKGTAAFLDFGQLERVAHAGENLLSLLRDGVAVLDSSLTTILLEMVDAIRAALEAIEEHGTDAGQDVSDLAERLGVLVANNGKRAEPEAAATVAAATETDALEPAAEPDVAATAPGGEAVETPPTPEPAIVEEAVPVEVAPADDAAAAPSAPAAAEPARDPGTSTQKARSADTSLRVDVGLLDRLMNLVSELVLARNQLLQHTGDQSLPASFDGAAQQLDLVTGELQQAVMDTRMQPVGNLFGRLPRMVRDLANTCGKSIELAVEGEDTELDKTLLEAIRDPLTHIVRNSVDHGIEDPETREANGKSRTGTVHIRARHEGGQVVIEIADDGAGINLDKLVNKVIDRGLMSTEAITAMSDRELANLIFLPGLSTAEAVTTVSGRGVGMDVVRRSLEEVGGAVDIQTEMGTGTTMVLRIPLTLAIIQALSVGCGNERYLIPQLNVLELHRISTDNRIETIGESPVYRLRGDLLPVIHWTEVLAAESDDPPSTIDWSDTYIVVIDAHGLTFGLAVDRVENTEEIVVKPLRSHVKDVRAFAGSSVMGDGTVALILDPTGITLSTRLRVDAAEAREAAVTDEVEAVHRDLETVLICEVADRRVAFPLDGITRLEHFMPSAVDRASDVEVVQYRDRLMRLLRLDDGLQTSSKVLASTDPDHRLLVLVHEHDDEVSGVVVDRILEVQEADVSGARPGHFPVRLSVPIDGLVTDVIDAGALVGAAGEMPVLEGVS